MSLIMNINGTKTLIQKVMYNGSELTSMKFGSTTYFTKKINGTVTTSEEVSGTCRLAGSDGLYYYSSTINIGANRTNVYIIGDNNTVSYNSSTGVASYTLKTSTSGETVYADIYYSYESTITYDIDVNGTTSYLVNTDGYFYYTDSIYVGTGFTTYTIDGVGNTIIYSNGTITYNLRASECGTDVSASIRITK